MTGASFSLSARRASLALAAVGVSLAITVGCSPPTPEALDRRLQPSSGKKKSPPPDKDEPATTTSSDAGSGGPNSGGTTTTTCETVGPNHKCGLDPQCGCLETETCDVSSSTTGATSCVTGGSVTLGRPCQVTGDCMAGLTCVWGACRPYCKTPLSKCSVGGTGLCVSYLDDAGKPIPNLNICTLSCDPREPSGVCGTNSCHWFPDEYSSKLSDCNFPGPRAVLEPCTDSRDCKPGLACINHPRVGRECERWCRLDIPSDCGSDPAFTCQDVFGANAPVVNGHKEGVCQD